MAERTGRLATFVRNTHLRRSLAPGPNIPLRSKNSIARLRVKGKGLSQLLLNPLRSWSVGHLREIQAVLKFPGLEPLERFDQCELVAIW